jgi:tetratricopeptide (TPR) repeat protein
VTLAITSDKTRLRQRGVAIAATLASPVIVYMVVLAAMSQLPIKAVSGGWAPADPAPELKQLLQVVGRPNQKVSPTMMAEAREALAAAPLAYEPFFIAGQAAEEAGRSAQALTLMTEARRRRPTFAATRLKVSLYYMQRERYAEALNELDVVMGRNEELRKHFIPALIKAAAYPQGREALATVLAGEPDWRAQFVEMAGAGGMSSSAARDLYQRIAARKPSKDLALERQLIFQTQASSGDFEGARQTWLQGLPRDEQGRNALLFDGTFRGLKAPKPFSWTFTDTTQGRAEPAKDGNRTYLDVAYFGGSNAEVAEQVLALPPGRYTLHQQTRAEGMDAAATSRIYWRLNCLPGGLSLTTLPLPLVNGERVSSATFNVPASGCPGQKLSLVAEPGEVARAVNLQVLQLEVRR